MHPITKITLSAVIGYIAWSGQQYTLPLAILFPILWSTATRRSHAALIAMAYYLAASRGLPAGAATFFASSIFDGLFLWMAICLTLSAAWAMLWFKQKNHRIYALPVILIIISVPPIGIVGVSNPITAAGVLFPGAGWFGLVATIAIMMIPLKAKLPTIAVFLLPCYINASDSELSQWSSINTEHKEIIEPLDDYFRQEAIVSKARQNPAEIIVLPESTAGTWNEMSPQLWQTNKTLLIGAEIKTGNSYDNTIIVTTNNKTEVVYRQRMPVPVSMWRPWSDKGANAHWFSDPVFEVNGTKAGALICYEQFIIWPVLQTLSNQPELLIGTSSVWWAKDTSIPAIQQVSLKAWAKLFNLPLITATNI